ncbi:DUF397 domain-containing protein [Marinactinospora thermotolerans]|uniref:DUF397 domain-containing protein n=1 Tax=Marinactinospora thermotolerans DSM 45154 TaxID=1122192 RepID=A0A1T4PBS6_9ACTN|nr:DUF397 domain-containing protein [Marinactinospora thermotolerans]SJZ88821.1 protein of unknown function [Marinactinospora thermotolerans DSM 45154]
MNTPPLGLRWHKSTYSGNQGGQCVEVAETPKTVYVRDTQNRDLGALGFTPAAFAAFVEDVKADRL